MPPPSTQPPRVALFTDTLADINGVSRFIRTIAEHAPSLHVLTSTRFDCPSAPNIHNIPPRFARPMPGYATLDIVLPRAAALAAAADALAPEVVHISTPGPVGLVGRRYALKRSLPLLGTYHTDFPAYIDHLFDTPPLTSASRAFMRWFYKPFARIFSRSDGYAASLVRLGIPADRIVRLHPGIDTDTFHIRHRDPSIWFTIPGARPNSIKLLYVGRVSVEKNLPSLARLWPRLREAARATDFQLVIIGDGPYRLTMQQELAAHDVLFLGFRHGRELSTLYASSDLFLFPSTTDTLGQVVMEAQCSGLPVLVTDQGGPREVVDDRITGFVLPALDAPHAEDRWLDAAKTLLTNPDLRRTMSQAAHAKIAPMSIRHSLDHFLSVHRAEKKPGHTLACGPARR